MDKIPSKWPQNSKNKEFSGKGPLLKFIVMVFLLMQKKIPAPASPTALTLNCHHPSSTVCSGQNIFENIQNLKNHFSPKGLDEIFKFQLQTFKKCLYKML